MNEKKALFALTGLIYVIAALHIAALYFFWYWSIWWYDIMMHTLMGFWIGSMTLIIASRKIDTGGNFIRFGLPILVAFIIGILWEMFEWHIDRFVIVRFQTDIIDTLSDLASDIAGGLMATLIGFHRNRDMITTQNTNEQ